MTPLKAKSSNFKNKRTIDMVADFNKFPILRAHSIVNKNMSLNDKIPNITKVDEELMRK